MRSADDRHELKHLGPAPDEKRSLLVHRCLLIRAVEHETAKARESIGCALGFVLANAIISGDDNPNGIVFGKHRYPCDVRRVAAAGKVGNVMGAMPLVADESVQRARENR
jgi:hypothetical protein